MRRRGKAGLRQVLAQARNLDAYDVGETIEGIARRLEKKPSEIIKLNSNENFFVPLDFLKSILREVVEEVDPRIYARDEQRELKEALGRYIDISPKMIVVGTGSDQLIDLITRVILKHGDEALSIAPTFSIYERCVAIQGGVFKAVPLKDDFSLDVEAMLASITPKTKLILLCSPNNPTANQFVRQDIRLLAENFLGLVAVDEAYVDFAGGSVVDLVGEIDNLVVFRTFSKVFGLAGLRLGCMIASPELTKVMDEKFQLPYTVTITAVKTALKLLERIDIIKAAIEEVKAERGRLIERLNQIDGVHAFDSETNFVLFNVMKDSQKVYEALLGKGVIMRNIGHILHLDNCLRVTVAPPPMTDRFLNTLCEVLAKDVA